MNDYDRFMRWPTRVLVVLALLGMLWIAGHMAIKL
jgi:hypothetical protein